MARRLALSGLVVALTAAAIFACSSDAADDLELDGGAYVFLDSAAPHDGAAHDGSTTGLDASNTSGELDGAVHDDGGGGEPADCTTCDCDGDGHTRPSCGGDDCDDGDPLVHPDAGFVTRAPGKDYDCSGVIEKQYPTGVSCAGHLLGCNAVAGFTSDTGCGETAEYVTCTAPVGVLLCNVKTSALVTQGCK